MYNTPNMAYNQKHAWFDGGGIDSSNQRRYRAQQSIDSEYDRRKQSFVESRTGRVGLGRRDLAHTQGRVAYHPKTYGEKFTEVGSAEHHAMLGGYYDHRIKKGYGGLHNTRVKENDDKFRNEAMREMIKQKQDRDREVTLFGGAPGAVDEEIKYRNSNEDPYSRSFPSDIQASFEEQRQARQRSLWADRERAVELEAQAAAEEQQSKDGVEALVEEVNALEKEAARKKSQIRSLMAHEGGIQSTEWQNLPPLSQVHPDQLEEYFTILFALEDANTDGVLQPAEFAALIEHATADDTQVELLLSAVEVNDDGLVECEPFVAKAAALLRGGPAAANYTRSELSVPECISAQMQALFDRLSSSPKGGMVLSDIRCFLSCMIKSPPPGMVTDVFESMLCELGNEAEPPVNYQQFSQSLMRILYQAFDRLQDPSTGTVVPAAVEKFYGTVLEPYKSLPSSPAASPALSACPASSTAISPLNTPSLSGQMEPDRPASRVAECKVHMHNKRRAMRGLDSESVSAASSPMLPAQHAPTGSSSRSGSPLQSPELSATSAPAPTPPAEMTFDAFITFVVSELRRACSNRRFHEGLALVYSVGTATE